MAVRRGVILLSGGLDSATTLALAVRDGWTMHALTVRYGQRHELELERARELAAALGAVEHRVVDVELAGFGGSALTDGSVELPRDRDEATIGRGIPATYVPARNTVLLALALAWAETLGARDLFIGANAVDYSGYPDCRPEYLEAFAHAATLGTRAADTGDVVRVRAPLLDWPKSRIVREAAAIGVDVGRTLSCYAPGERGEPCARCDACRLRARGFRDAGLIDPSAG